MAMYTLATTELPAASAWIVLPCAQEPAASGWEERPVTPSKNPECTMKILVLLQCSYLLQL